MVRGSSVSGRGPVTRKSTGERPGGGHEWVEDTGWKILYKTLGPWGLKDKFTGTWEKVPDLSR